jgi:hypothetical protein
MGTLSSRDTDVSGSVWSLAQIFVCVYVLWHRLSLLREDVVVIGDGGGVVLAATRPIHGAHAVARFFAGLAAHATA